MDTKRELKTGLVMVVVVCLAMVGTAVGGIIYVDASASGSNNGSSWTNAYNYLQDALADANSLGVPVEIWVAEGIHTPDSNSGDPNGSGDRTATFQLINDVALKGGYAGFGEPNPNARDIEAYETVLSGDLDGNDVGFANNAENSYHVVTGSGTDANAVLDGFTLTAGNANGSGTDRYGGGMYNDSGSPTLNNCTFTGNSANYYGGGMYNDSGSPMLTNCTFTGNSANYYGGGMYNKSYSSPMLTNCTFTGNSANYYGGGMYNYGDSSPMLTNCTFTGNSANYYGGGMYNYGGSNPAVTNCTFSGNSADYGGGMYNYVDSSPMLTNCILWGDTPQEVYGGAVITYSDVQGGWAGDDNINTDPCFVDADGPDDTVGTEDDNLRLWAGSPCIDAGDNNSVPDDIFDVDNDGNTIEPLPWDLDGRPRIADGDCNDTEIVDMGAYEFAWGYLGDFDGQCDVDIDDLAFLCDQWLLEELSWDVWPNGGDGFVNFLDWAIFADEWGVTVDIESLVDFAGQWLKSGSNYYIADIAPLPHGDGTVNFLDFAALANNWLAGL
jgi:parallel beta-helix repeat protein